ncbi:hypothetical protein CU633_09990 [Bacillus sp. V3-13]|uniref:DUF7668 domain-containing protein n=1 Tax=Bacillus sp. V3-13 TaxID=2053728 RepID=UPI000C78E944|nr:hypothetical protein [Bacillus sp. V3-13]PLR77521.1 hypothetical protein CU633_09990 [Bacillus sp. V3-13]
MQKSTIIALLKPLVNSLVKGEYEFIQQSGRSGLYTAGELKDLIDDYGGKLTIPPEEDYENINIIAIDNEPEYVVEYELWVNGEKSDLTLSCTIHIKEDEKNIVIENIHVL